MSVFDSARQLGKELLETEEAKRLVAANEAFKNNEEAVQMINDYNEMQQSYQKEMSQGTMSKEDMEAKVNEIMAKGDAIKAHEICGELINAQNDFNRFMNKVLSIVQATIAGEPEDSCDEGGCSSGCCSSCGGGCH